MRVSDRARDAVVRKLGQDCARGYLSLDTLAWRVERALAARSADELATLRSDLPPGGPFAPLVERLRLWWSERRESGCVAVVPNPLEPERAYVVGRSPGCDLVLADRAVSRRHAALRVEAGRWLISDLGSRNGTRVNGWLVSEAHIDEGDELTLGRTRLRFHPARAR
jgi:Inner membrane component of T3SS, cytoplasmic domain/Domain of unknown function (DUF1707)